jgi:large subunit ribosomal protein L24
MASKIKVGDSVVVIAGNDKGQRGTVQRVDHKRGRVVVTGVNMVRKAQRATQAGRGKTQTGIIEFEGPIHISNVMLIDPETDEPTRVGFGVNDAGEKVRVSRKSGKELG